MVTSSVGIHSHVQVKLTTVGHEHCLQVSGLKVRVKQVGGLTEGDLLKPSVVFQIWIHARERRLFSFHCFLNRCHCIHQVSLRWKLHVVTGHIRGWSSDLFLISKGPVHRQAIIVSFTVVNHRVSFVRPWVLEMFKLFIIKDHRDWSAVYIFGSPSKLHVGFERILTFDGGQVHRRQRVNDILAEA
jgi:hypothetical protein